MTDREENASARTRPDAGTREERDALGSVPVPADAYYGAHTARAIPLFRIGTERLPRPFLRALALIKQAAAETLAELGELDAAAAGAIARAAGEMAAGELDDHFPLPVWQTGSGTHTNINANEVLANRANELAGRPLGSYDPVHPLDHVNRGQSSNDVIPTALHVSLASELATRLEPELEALAVALAGKAGEFADLRKVGRTHLMDAAPVTLGMEFASWAAQVRHAVRALRAAREELHAVPLGGTAVGTGLNAPPGFAEAAIARLAALAELPLRPVDDRLAAQGAHDAVVQASGSLRTTAVALMKLANDVRLLASGPRCGFGELRLPANELGSSAMPGKINPTQAEALTLVCAQVCGNDLASAVGGLLSQLELNTFKPLLAHNALQSVALLADACRSFRVHGLDGLEADQERLREMSEKSLGVAAALVKKVGYDRAAEAVLLALREDLTLRAAVRQLDLMTDDEYDAAMDALLPDQG
jgi:fumarate hydratase class II